MRRWAWLVLASFLAGCASVGGSSLSIPPLNVPGARKPSNPLTATLALPPGTGPLPVVIVLHGCGGLVPARMAEWTRRLNDWGYAAVVLDSFGPRGVTTVCAPSAQHLVTPADRAGDVLSTAVYLRSLPQIDGTRIGVLGLSHGGSTAAGVTQRRYERLYPGLLRASVDYYGPCRSPETYGDVPLLALAGDPDDWGNPALTCHAFAAKLRPGEPFEIHTYPDTYHAFDNDHSTAKKVEGHVLAYNHDAAEDSFIRTRNFLDRRMAPGQ
jgi:dienelactone hydrolase